MDDLIRRNDTLNAVAQYCVGCESCDGIRCRGCQIDDALSIIENCEEVDAEPVRYAKWVWNDNAMDWNIGANNNNRITEKRIIRMLKNNTIDDFLSYCPQHKAKVDDVLSRIFAICERLDSDWATNQPVSSRKEFALQIKNLKSKDFLFRKYDDPSLKAIDYILSLFTKTILRFLEEFKV